MSVEQGLNLTINICKLMNHNNTNTMNIRTPEGIVFSLHLAGPITRFLAWVIDLFFIMVVTNVTSAVVGLVGIISWDIAAALSVLGYFIVSMGYGVVMEYFWRGQTLGKRLFSLRVMDVQGLNLEFSQIVIRNLLRFVDSLPLFYLVGGVTSVISSKAQRLGDIAANTIVVRNPTRLEPDLDQVLPDKYNSFHDHPLLEARLRKHVTPQQAGIALQALFRREQLDPEARIELFQEIAAYFKKVVAFPQETQDGISDEQYVRNLVDTLFRPKGFYG